MQKYNNVIIKSKRVCISCAIYLIPILILFFIGIITAVSSDYLVKTNIYFDETKNDSIDNQFEEYNMFIWVVYELINPVLWAFSQSFEMLVDIKRRLSILYSLRRLHGLGMDPCVDKREYDRLFTFYSDDIDNHREERRKIRDRMETPQDSKITVPDEYEERRIYKILRDIKRIIHENKQNGRCTQNAKIY